MTTGTLPRRRSTWGMDSDPATPWAERAACLGYWDLFTEQLLPSGDAGQSANTPSAQAQHNCNHHCPVLLQCTLQAETPGQRPLEMVQAGQWWPGYTHRPPRTLPDPGHGEWCRHLRRRT